MTAQGLAFGIALGIGAGVIGLLFASRKPVAPTTVTLAAEEGCYGPSPDLPPVIGYVGTSGVFPQPSGQGGTDAGSAFDADEVYAEWHGNAGPTAGGNSRPLNGILWSGGSCVECGGFSGIPSVWQP